MVSGRENKRVAEKQAGWLEKVLAEERDKKTPRPNRTSGMIRAAEKPFPNRTLYFRN
jgi:hypothetical protein